MTGPAPVIQSLPLNVCRLICVEEQYQRGDRYNRWQRHTVITGDTAGLDFGSTTLRARCRPTEKADVVAGRARAGARARGEVVEARDRAEIAGSGLLRSSVRITEGADGARATVETSWADALAIDADDMLFHG